MLKLFKCARCEHEWASRQIKPNRCASCTRKLWWLPAKDIGRPRKYAVDGLRRGQSMNFDKDSQSVANLKQAVNNYGKRAGKRFAFVDCVTFIVCKRVL